MAKHAMETQLQVFDVAQAANQVREAQSLWLRRKDTIIALGVFLGYFLESSRGVDWSNSASWLPTVGVWVIAVIGVGIHALTKGAITKSGVERITAQAQEIALKKEG